MSDNIRVDGVYSQTSDSSQLLNQGRDFLRAGKALEALELYESLFNNMQKTHVDSSPEMFQCLQGLAESCFALQEFGEAGKFYERLMHACANLYGIHSREAATTLYRLAQCHEQQNRLDHAVAMYDQCLQVMPHVKLDDATHASILEDFSRLLKRSGRDAERAEILREEAQAIRQRGQRASVSAQQAQDDYPAEEDLPKANPAAKRAQLRGLKEHSALTEGEGTQRMLIQSAMIAVPVLLLLGGGIWYLCSQKPQDDAAQLAKQKQAQVQQQIHELTDLYPVNFTTADGTKEITILDHGAVEMTYFGKTLRAPYSCINGTDDKPHDFTKVKEGLRDAQGNYYFTDDAPELKNAKTMQLVATAAEKYRKYNNKFPANPEQLYTVAPELKQGTNPVTGDPRWISFYGEGPPPAHRPIGGVIECFTDTASKPPTMTIYTSDRNGNTIRATNGKLFSYTLSSGKIANSSVAGLTEDPPRKGLVMQVP